MKTPVDRRTFLGSAAAAGLAAGATRTVRAVTSDSANDTVVLGVMGVNGRGTDLARSFAAKRNTQIAYICDVDRRAIEKCQGEVAQRQDRATQGVGDFRRILEDPNVDALVVAAPNHWHAPATILACEAGKHVYVEKPASHNPHEGELMVAAARKHNRVVQLGTQRRSSGAITEGIQKLREGAIGDVLYARSWYNNRRGSIGQGKQAAVPEWLDYELWQGPAPDVPYQDNVVHYNWHWFWNWGNGELGNNGIHSIDVCRWGLGVDYPTKVTCFGGKYRHQDDQQTPDTCVATFEFGDKSMMWEGLSWSPRGYEQTSFGMSFHGEGGTMIMTEGYEILDMQNRSVETYSGGGGGLDHMEDFLDAIRTSRRPNADIEDGHKSTLLCHLGNIAHRVGRVLTTDPSNGHIQNDPEAAALWKREYRPGWEPKV
ncbi:MAG: Gfo/Idh/MocA family oxidoreductase [Pirellulales bacterium]